jgi:hypothetical protein
MHRSNSIMSLKRICMASLIAFTPVNAFAQSGVDVSTGLREPARLLTELADRSGLGARGFAGPNRPVYLIQPSYVSADGTAIIGGTFGIVIPRPKPIQIRGFAKILNTEPDSRRTFGADAKVKLLSGVNGFDLSALALFQHTVDVSSRGSASVAIDYTYILPTRTNWTVGVGATGSFIAAKPAGDGAETSSGGAVSMAGRLGWRNTELELNYRPKNDIDTADDYSAALAHKLTTIRFQPLLVAGVGKGNVLFATVIFKLP